MDLRQTLDHQMRRVLARLELISAIPACRYDTSPDSDDDPLGRRPPGDKGEATYYARRYGPPFHEPTSRDPGCLTNAEREDVLQDAEKELKGLQRGAPTDPTKVESVDATRRRMLEETAGWSLKDVALSHWRTSPTIMRRLRIADGRDAESGLFVDETSTGEDLASRAKVMKQAGMSLRGIGMALGVDQKQVQRLLRRVA